MYSFLTTYLPAIVLLVVLVLNGFVGWLLAKLRSVRLRFILAVLVPIGIWVAVIFVPDLFTSYSSPVVEGLGYAIMLSVITIPVCLLATLLCTLWKRWGEQIKAEKAGAGPTSLSQPKP